MNTVKKNTNKEKIKYLTYEDVREENRTVSKTNYRYQFHIEQYKARAILDLDNQPLSSIAQDLSELKDEDIKFIKDYINLFNENHPDKYRLLSRLVDIYKKGIVSNEYASREEIEIDSYLHELTEIYTNDGFSKYIGDCTDEEKRALIVGGRFNYFREWWFKKIKNDEKKELLQGTFDIFKRLKNRDKILSGIFEKERAESGMVKYLDDIATSGYRYFNEREYNVFNTVSKLLLNRSEFLFLLVHKPEYFEQVEKQVKKYNKILKDFFPNVKDNGR